MVTEGESLRDQLEAVWKRTGVKPPELDNPYHLDEMFYEVWGWFLTLNKKRGSNGFGINPISYTEIKSFFDLQQYCPQQWEIKLIEEWDDIALEVYSEQQEKNRKQQEQKSKLKIKKR